MKENVAIFSDSYDIDDNPYRDATDHWEWEIGEMYNCWLEYRMWVKDQKTLVKTALKSKLYDWLIGLYDFATILLPYKGYKRILINPTVGCNDLNNVSDFAKQHTYGFFDLEHKKDYELFQSVYPHSFLFSKSEKLRLSDVRGIITEILGVSQWLLNKKETE